MRVWTLVQAQVWELRRHMLIVFAPVMVLFMCFIFVQAPRGGGDLAGMFEALGLLLSAYMVGWQTPSIAIAEEKEKRTLEALALTPARPLEIILAKAAVAVVLAVLTAAGAAAVFREVPARPWLVLGAFALALVFTVAGGTLLGLILPDMKSVSTIGTFTILALMFSGFPVFALTTPGLWRAMAWLPTRPLFELMRAGWTGQGSDLLRHALVALAYTAGTLWLCVRVFRRQAAG